ncbi:MAG: hypothetical protein EOO61_16960 [Hymenobacter sp.]|nr:MAG: hypothetical protein EOO61_16960 [Hymenobacter sp.]
MSWDILLLNSTIPVDFETDIWADFEPRTALITRFQQTFPDSQWVALSWGTLHSDQAAIEFNLGIAEEPGNTVMLHVYGGQDPVSEIARLCHQHGWIAYDMAAEQFIGNGQAAYERFNAWEKYRADVLSQKDLDR